MKVNRTRHSRLFHSFDVHRRETGSEICNLKFAVTARQERSSSASCCRRLGQSDTALSH